MTAGSRPNPKIKFESNTGIESSMKVVMMPKLETVTMQHQFR